MPKGDHIEMQGVVSEVLPNTQFRVVLENGADVLLGPSVAAEDLRGVTQMLVRVLLIIKIVDQADDAPHLVVRSSLACDVPHDGLDRQGVVEEGRVFHVIRKDCPCFFARRVVTGHVSILKEVNGQCASSIGKG